MNPVAIALGRAAERASNRSELVQAFDEEWSNVEFAQDAESVVVGVSAAVAKAWFREDLPDVDLCLAACDPPQAIWWATLPRIGQYRSGLECVRAMYNQGATSIAFQTMNPVLIQHGQRFGFEVNHLDDGFTRLFGNEHSLAKWLGNT